MVTETLFVIRKLEIHGVQTHNVVNEEQDGLNTQDCELFHSKNGGT